MSGIRQELCVMSFVHSVGKVLGIDRDGEQLPRLAAMIVGYHTLPYVPFVEEVEYQVCTACLRLSSLCVSTTSTTLTDLDYDLYLSSMRCSRR